ncbi:MAG: UDP-N-acetylmuramoyl-L-alanine--D-glutamate ligase [Candidatus Moranbacteria bacterium]|nr:UDP-N-acetylmuramoyl-L-alanine--D-glutamate ligase [Candidatus Moranbacteria bacterium]
MYKDKKVTIMGLGLQGSGIEMVRFFVNKGAKVTVTDIKTKEKLQSALDKLKDFKKVRYVLGQHRPEDFSKADLVIKGPGVSWNSKYLQIAQKNKVPVETEAGIFIKLVKNPIIGITGTRGKSTTTQIIYEILKKANVDVAIGGNIKEKPLIKLLMEVKKESTWLVVELSSFQLEGMRAHKKSPQLAVITNLMVDHMNRYKTVEDYHGAKKTILRFQGREDFAVLNQDDEQVRQLTSLAKGNIFFFSTKKLGCENAAFIFKDKIMFRNNRELEEICNVEELKIIGRHRYPNILAAVCVAKIFNVSSETIKKVVENFSFLEHRLEIFKQVDGITFVNDTTASVPEATIHALDSFGDKNIILIAGGADKKLDFSQMANKISEKVNYLILLPGRGSDRILNAIRKCCPQEFKNEGSFIKVENLDQAVEKAKEVARQNDLVLMSPACSSFNLFNNEFERGDKFKEAVEKIF